LHKNIRILTLWFVFVVFAFISMFSLIENFANDPGLGWHMSAGQKILEQQEIPSKDPFLFFSIDRSWQVEQWLAEVIFYKLYAIGEWPLLYALFFSLYIFTFIYYVYHNLQFLTLNRIAGVMAALLCFKFAQTHFVLRPVLFSMFFCVLTYFILLNSSKSKKPIKAGSIFILLIISILWANTHPSFPLMLVLLTSFLIESAFKIENRNLFWWALLALSLTFFGTLINPYGYKLYILTYQVVTSNFISKFYQEWQPIDWISPEGQLFSISLLIILYFLITKRSYRKELGLFSFILTVLLALWSIDSRRMLVYYGIVSSYPLALALKLLLTNINHKAIKEALNNLELKEPKAILIPSLMISSTLFFIILLGQDFFKSKQVRYGPSEGRYPYKALNYIATKPEATIKVINEMDWGGFLIWNSKGKIKTFIDDRTILLGEDFYLNYFKAIKTSKDFINLAKNNEADYIILDNKREIVEDFKLHYSDSVVYNDEIATIIQINHEKQ
jgi:hypothetical protein